MSHLKNENFTTDRSKDIRKVTLSEGESCMEETGLDHLMSSSGSLKRKFLGDSDSTDSKNKRNSLEICVSPWEYRRLKADLMESQAQRIKLEDRIDQLHKKNKEAVIFFDKEKSEMKTLLEANRNTIRDLEFRLNKIRKREIECKDELSEKHKVFEMTKIKLNERINELDKENKELKIAMSKVESDYGELKQNLNEEINSLKVENQQLRLNVAEKEELSCSLNSRLVTATERIKKQEEIQHQFLLAQLKIKDLESEQEEFKEAKSVTVALSEKVLRVTELEKELSDKKLQVANLKQCLQNNILLEEMVLDLKTKLSTLEEKELEVPNLRGKIVELEMELEKWKCMATNYCSDSKINTLSDYIECLQKKDVSNSLENNSLAAAVKSSEKKYSNLEQKLEVSKIHNEKLETILQKLKVEVQLLRKKSILVSRERDSYRQQLDLYEKDLTMTGLPSENRSSDAESQLKSRIQNLEISLEEYKKHIETLEQQLVQYQMEGTNDNIERLYKLKEDYRKLEDANRALAKVKDDLEQKLEMKIAKGEFASPATKVLHLRLNNPAFQAERKQEQDISDLRQECDKLRSRVKLLESGEVLNITQKVAEDVKSCSSHRVNELEKELQSANLKMQRLKEVFKKTSQEFRDVNYILLGYRVDLTSNSKLYKLYNMYSNSPSDYLMFQQTKKGTMEMLGTTFAESMSKLVDEYLHKGNSIPAFLSAVTLELYRSNGHSDEDEEDDEEDDDDDDDDDDDSDNDNDGDEMGKNEEIRDGDDDDDDDDDGDDNYGDDDDDDDDGSTGVIIDVAKHERNSSPEAILLD